MKKGNQEAEKVKAGDGQHERVHTENAAGSPEATCCCGKQRAAGAEMGNWAKGVIVGPGGCRCVSVSAEGSASARGGRMVESRGSLGLEAKS